MLGRRLGKTGKRVIYDYGVENVPITIDDYNGLAQKASDHIYLFWNNTANYGRACLQTTNKINLTGYTKLKAFVNVVAYNATYQNILSVTPTKVVTDSGNIVPDNVGYKRPTGTGEQTVILDIAGINGDYYIGYMIDYLNTTNVYKIWLE